jgi:hypothetical protein
MNVDVVAEGPTLVLKLTPYSESKSIYKIKRKNTASSVLSGGSGNASATSLASKDGEFSVVCSLLQHLFDFNLLI